MSSYFFAQLPSSKPRRKYRSVFLTKLFKLLESEEHSDLIRWSKDGTQVELLKPCELAATVFPKLYKHSKLTSFIKQVVLKANSLRLKIDRIQIAPKEKVSVKPQPNEENNQDRKDQFLPFEPNKKIKTSSSSISLAPKSSEERIYWPELSLKHPIEQNLIFSEVSMQQSVFDLVVSNENKEQMTRETPSFLDNFEYVFEPFTSNENNRQMTRKADSFLDNFQALVQIASNSKGNIQDTNVTLFSQKLTNLFVNKLPAGFCEFQGILEKMLGFGQIDGNGTENPQALQNNLEMYQYYSNL